jgi:plastocyanin
MATCSVLLDPVGWQTGATETVKWDHQGAGVTHTVTALDKTFDSGDLEEGEEFSHPFRTAGTFAYRCTVRTDMRRTVKVGG